MLAQVVRRPHRLGRGQNPEPRHRMREMATDGDRRAWCPPLPMNWKRPSCVVSDVSSNRRVWPEPEIRSQYSRSSVGRKKLGGTILALAGPGKSTRSATARDSLKTIGCPILVAFFATGWGI